MGHRLDQRTQKLRFTRIGHQIRIPAHYHVSKVSQQNGGGVVETRYHKGHYQTQQHNIRDFTGLFLSEVYDDVKIEHYL